jgi:sulfofructose kinase
MRNSTDAGSTTITNPDRPRGVPIPESRSQIDVFGLGQCCLDHLGQVEEYPPPDAKCEVSDLVIQGGGPAATALVALASWGMSCAIAGVVGDDRFGI